MLSPNIRFELCSSSCLQTWPTFIDFLHNVMGVVAFTGEWVKAIAMLFIYLDNSKRTEGQLLLLEISKSRNCSSVGYLKCVQFYNWFRLHWILYLLQNILGGATHNVRTVRETTQRKCNALKKRTKYTRIWHHSAITSLISRSAVWFLSMIT